jgi:hypothetical protein
MTKILLRRDSNVNLQGVVLSSGEPAIALDLNILKIGDGSTAWENLDPIGDSGSLSAAGVSSLNGLTGGVSIAEGDDIQVTVAGSSITISYTGTGGGGGVVTETDPVFTGSAAYNITNTDISNWNSTYNSDIVVSGDNISLLNNDAGYLDAHPTIAGAGPSSNANTGNTFVQNITVDSFGHITDITTAVATSGSAGASGITALVEDTAPQLGGDLDAANRLVYGVSGLYGGDNGEISISGHLMPNSNSSYDLGSAELKWRHLYLSSNSLKFVSSSDIEYPLSVDNDGNLTFGASSGVIALKSDTEGFISAGDNVGLLDGNVMYDYTLSGGTVGTLNPSSSTVKVNILRINPSAELIIQGIIPPSDGSAKIYDKFTLINISDNTVKLKHNSGTTINRIWLDSSVSDGVETVLRKGESAELYYVNGTFDSVSSSRWLCTLNQNELNGDVVAGTGISLTYTTGINQLEISADLYSAPDGIAGASGVNNIVVMSSGDYTALATKNPTTLYFIK